MRGKDEARAHGVPIHGLDTIAATTSAPEVCRCQDACMGTVDDYLAELAPDDRAAIAHVYELARELVPDAEQGKGYGMPALVYRGKPLLSVMRAKKHIGVYPFSPAAVSVVAPQLPPSDVDKGTVRFQPDRPLPDDVVRALVTARKVQIEG